MSEAQSCHIEQHDEASDLDFWVADGILESEDVAAEDVLDGDFVWIAFLWKGQKIDGKVLERRGKCWLTDAEDVNLSSVVVLLRQHALDLHLEHRL
jgi:hypothetical protein